MSQSNITGECPSLAIVLSIGLDCASIATSFWACFAVHYVIKRFGSGLSWALLFMNVFNMMDILLSLAEPFTTTANQTLLRLFALVCGTISAMLYMYQIMCRMWLLPRYNRVLYRIQWAILIVSTGFYAAGIVCFIPTNSDLTTVVCPSQSNIVLGIAGGLQILLEIGNSIYVIYNVKSRGLDEEDSKYLDFSKKRIPILVTTIALSIIAIIFIIINYPDSYQTASLVDASILLFSGYYFVDFRSVMLGLSDHSNSGSNHNSRPQPVSPGQNRLSSATEMSPV